jgi:cellulose synthase/poly-beta-1,6-N-acetylglucosamine synthase-like glycosyltransferase
LVEKDGVTKLVNELSDPNVSAVSGNVRILSGDSGKKNLLVRLQEYEYFLAFELGRRFSSIFGTMMIISGAFGAFRSAEMKALGQYDKDTITEDFDLTLKLRKLRKKLVYNDKAVSWTFAPDTWPSWRNQRIRWTKGEAETLWKHRNVFRIKGFDYTSVFSIYDMLFNDVILLVLRVAWLFSLFFFFPTSLFYVLILSIIMYLLMEFIATILAVLLSKNKRNLRHLIYVPIMVLAYRPYYSLVRLWAYFKWVAKKKTNW